jgi:L-rhamnose mutarotase
MGPRHCIIIRYSIFVQETNNEIFNYGSRILIVRQAANGDDTMDDTKILVD